MSGFGTFSLADVAAQAEASQMRRQQMELQREQFDWQKSLQQMKLDEQQREALKETLKDVSAAVQWADTPEKWAQVQQFYGQHDQNIAQVPFEQRETALISLGQMGEYLKATKPDIRAIEPGGSLFSIGGGGEVKELVRANPGTAAPASPVSQVQEGATATNPQTGEKLIYRGGRWQPMGGTGGNVSGGFPTDQ